MNTAASTTPANPSATIQRGSERCGAAAGTSVGTEISRTDSVGSATLAAGISPMGSGISQATSALQPGALEPIPVGLFR